MTAQRFNSLRAVFLCIVLGILLQFFAGSILVIIFSFFQEAGAQYSSNMSVLVENNIETVLFVVVFSPIFEELVFRFAILGLAGKFCKFTIANVIQGLLFGIYHRNLVQGIYAFLLGMIIGYIKQLTGSVVYCMILHASINLVGLISSAYIVIESLVINVVIAIITAILSATVIVILRNRKYVEHTL